MFQRAAVSYDCFRQVTPVAMMCGTHHDASAAGVGEIEVAALEPRHPRPDNGARKAHVKQGIKSATMSVLIRKIRCIYLLICSWGWTGIFLEFAWFI